jgi:hypothetical protein
VKLKESGEGGGGYAKEMSPGFSSCLIIFEKGIIFKN